VEALIQGESAAVEELEAWANIGPSSAEVKNVFSEKVAIDPSLKIFERRETA